ncbi:MAG: carbohydrate porin [Gammaproteobacteria bacterium]
MEQNRQQTGFISQFRPHTVRPAIRPPHYYYCRLVVLFMGCLWLPATQAQEDDINADINAEILRELRALKERVNELEAELASYRKEEAAAEDEPPVTTAELQIIEPLVDTRARQVYEDLEAEKAEDIEGITVGGAVRAQYSVEDFNAGNRDRAGDFDFDTLRINLDGSLGDVLLSAEYRFYQFMNVIHHAWVGYDFTDTLQGQVGIHQVPFGVLPFNSHNFFFSSNYYLGLEDDYDMGVKFIYDEQTWNLQFAFYKNDEQGSMDGFVSDRSDRYSFDVVGFRDPGEGIFANPIGETNTFNARAAYTFAHAENYFTEIGVSGQYGNLHDGNTSAGDNIAYAAHINGVYDRWNLQLQAARYDYDMDSGASLLAGRCFQLLRQHSGPGQYLYR